MQRIQHDNELLYAARPALLRIRVAVWLGVVACGIAFGWLFAQ
jgi:hypothetical protein